MVFLSRRSFKVSLVTDEGQVDGPCETANETRFLTNFSKALYVHTRAPTGMLFLSFHTQAALGT